MCACVAVGVVRFGGCPPPPRAQVTLDEYLRLIEVFHSTRYREDFLSDTVFALFDKNGDGSIDRAELEHAAVVLVGPADAPQVRLRVTPSSCVGGWVALGRAHGEGQRVRTRGYMRVLVYALVDSLVDVLVDPRLLVPVREDRVGSRCQQGRENVERRNAVRPMCAVVDGLCNWLHLMSVIWRGVVGFQRLAPILRPPPPTHTRLLALARPWLA